MAWWPRRVPPAAAAVGGAWRKYVDVGGVPTELFGVDAKGPAKLQIFIIAGNPGSAAYFQPFLRYLDEQLGGEADILAPTHAGHDPGPHHTGRLWTLEEQTQHKVDVMAQHVMLAGRAPVVVLGHSIGCHMMLAAVRQLEAQLAGRTDLPRIVKLVGLMPFLETDFRVFRQRCLRLAAPRYELIGWLAVLLGALPAWLSELILRNSSKDQMDPAAVRTTRELMYRPSIRNNFFLAMHEFQDLSRPAGWHLLGDFGERLSIMCCPNDTWMSREMYDTMRAIVPALQTSWEEDLTHAFVVSVRQSKKVACLVAALARDAVASPGHQPAASPLPLPPPAPASPSGRGRGRPPGPRAQPAAAASGAEGGSRNEAPGGGSGQSSPQRMRIGGRFAAAQKAGLGPQTAAATLSAAAAAVPPTPDSAVRRRSQRLVDQA